MNDMTGGQLQPAGGLVVSDHEMHQVRSASQQIFREISSLEIEIQNSKNMASELESRGLWKRMRSSSSKDLAAISRTQNSINTRMVDLIQETIQLNMLSYSGLSCLLDEMRKGIESGFKDANGNLKKLGEAGRDLAGVSIKAISGIMASSRKTQQELGDITQSLKLKDDLDSSQSQDIASLKQQSDAKFKLHSVQSRAIAHLAKKAKEKGDLDDRQQEAIDAQGLAIEKLAVRMSLISDRAASGESVFRQNQESVDSEIKRIQSSVRNLQYIVASLGVFSAVVLALVVFR